MDATRRKLTFGFGLGLVAAGLTAPGPGGFLGIRESRAAGPVLLTVRNKASAVTAFDLDALRALPQGQLTLNTPWTEGESVYTGPWLRAVLAAADAEAGERLTLTALNDYAVNVPMADVRRYTLLLAMNRDGTAMPVRDKGPLWLLYPLEEIPSASRNEIHSRMIWQLRDVTVA